MRCCLHRFSVSVAKHIWLSQSLILTSFNCYSFPKSPASVTSVIFNLTVVATSFLMEIFLTLISAALNLSASIFFLSYHLWQRFHVIDRKKGLLPALFLASPLHLTSDNRSSTGPPTSFYFLSSCSQPSLCTQTQQLLLLKQIITHVCLLTLPNISWLICSSLSMCVVSAKADAKIPLKCFHTCSNTIFSPSLTQRSPLSMTSNEHI